MLKCSTQGLLDGETDEQTEWRNDWQSWSVIGPAFIVGEAGRNKDMYSVMAKDALSTGNQRKI